MSKLPLSAFPLSATESKSSGFVIAVLIGLAFFMSAKIKADSQRTTQ